MFKNLYYGWWVVLACFTISLYVGGVNFFSFTAFFEPIQQEFGWSYTQISFATSLRGLEMGIFAPLVGFLVDRFGSRRLLIFGTVIIGIGLILMSFTQSLPMFYLCILFIAFGAGGCTMVVTMKAVASWFKNNASLALGIMACGFGIGGLMIPLVVLLINSYGWRSTLVILGIGVWLLCVPLSLVVRDRPEQLISNPDRERTKSPKTSAREESFKSKKALFIAAIRQKSFSYLIVAETIRMMVINTVFIHIMPYLSSIGMSRDESGTLAGVLPLVSIFGRIGFGWLGDRYDKRIVWAATIFLISAGLFAFCHVQSFWILLLFIVSFAPGYAGGTVVRSAMIHEYFGIDSFGKMLGLVLGFGSVGGIIGPTMAGWVFDTLGSYIIIWYGFAIISGATIFLVMKIKPSVADNEETA